MQQAQNAGSRRAARDAMKKEQEAVGEGRDHLLTDAHVASERIQEHQGRTVRAALDLIVEDDAV